MKPVGTEVAHEAAIGLKAWRGTVNPMRRAHSHADIEINFLLRGEMTYIHAGNVVHVPERRMLILWAGMPHHMTHVTPRSDCIWVTLPLAWFLQLRLGGTMVHDLLLGQAWLGNAKDAERDALLLSGWVDDIASRRVSSRVIALLEIEARLRRAAEERRRRAAIARSTDLHPAVDAALAFIHAHYTEDLHAKEIAAAVAVHPKYLLQMFRRNCQISLWEYVLRLRVSHAQRLLLTTREKIVDIAYAAGFQNLAPFYEAFAKYSGKRTPLVYRKQAVS